MKKLLNKIETVLGESRIGKIGNQNRKHYVNYWSNWEQRNEPNVSGSSSDPDDYRVDLYIRYNDYHSFDLGLTEKSFFTEDQILENPIIKFRKGYFFQILENDITKIKEIFTNCGFQVIHNL